MFWQNTNTSTENYRLLGSIDTSKKLGYSEWKIYIVICKGQVLVI